MFKVSKLSMVSFQRAILLSVLIMFNWENTLSILPFDAGKAKSSYMKISKLVHSLQFGG